MITRTVWCVGSILLLASAYERPAILACKFDNVADGDVNVSQEDLHFRILEVFVVRRNTRRRYVQKPA